jgi:hypothetical protein
MGSTVTLQPTRAERWAAKHPTLWCRGCQSFRLWHRTEEGNLLCARCDRVLIASPLFPSEVS